MPESAVESILSRVNHFSPSERESLVAALTRTETEPSFQAEPFSMLSKNSA